MKQIARALAFILCFLGTGYSALAASNPSDVPHVPNIAAMQALGGAAAQYTGIIADGYYTAGDGGGGYFSWLSASTAAADQCTTFAATGVSTGRFSRQLDGSPLDVKMCGLHWDGATDDAALFSNAFAVAATTPGKRLTCPGGTGYIASSVTMSPGVILQCQGFANSHVTPASNVTAFVLQLPNGTASIISPQILDLDIEVPSASSGGCIQLNSISGGFSVDASTQEVFQAPRFRVQCVNGAVNGTGIGIQVSKAFDADISNSEIFGFETNVDYEGCENCLIHNATRLIWASSIPVIFNAQSTWGNYDVLEDVEVLQPNTSIMTSLVRMSPRSFTIKHVHLEASTMSMPCAMDIEAGTNNTSVFEASISDNDVVAALANNWLCKGAPVNSLVATNNITSGTMNAALFDGGTGTQLYPFGNGTPQKIVHYSNSNDVGFPYGSTAQGGPMGANTLWDINPGSQLNNIAFSDYGTQVKILNGGYQVPAIASFGSTIDFTNPPAVITGAISYCVLASSTNTSTVPTIEFLDGGTPVTSHTFTPTGHPQWFCNTGSPTTGATFKIYNDDTTHGGIITIYELAIQQT